jgi:hypothetical protein
MPNPFAHHEASNAQCNPGQDEGQAVHVQACRCCRDVVSSVMSLSQVADWMPIWMVACGSYSGKQCYSLFLLLA